MEKVKNRTQEPFKIIGNWDDQSQKLKQKFSQLTDADLKFEPGREADLLIRIEARLNKRRDEVVSIITRGQPENV